MKTTVYYPMVGRLDEAGNPKWFYVSPASFFLDEKQALAEAAKYAALRGLSEYKAKPREVVLDDQGKIKESL